MRSMSCTSVTYTQGLLANNCKNRRQFIPLWSALHLQVRLRSGFHYILQESTWQTESVPPEIYLRQGYDKVSKRYMLGVPGYGPRAG